MNDKELSRELIKELAAYLLANMSSISSADQILQEWPESNFEMEASPTISIITVDPPTFTPHINPEIVDSAVNGSNPNEYDYKYSVGQFDYTIQVDIWCDYKEERHVVFQEFFHAMNKKLVDQGHTGVTLTLTDYYGAPVHFVVTGYNYGDSEEASQRKEWRVKIDLLVNAEAILEATQAAMIDNDSVTDIGDDINIE